MPERFRLCPVHFCELHRDETQWGDRWQCPRPGCTVRCWDGDTSTPCDQQTADARHSLHGMFDPLWQERWGPFKHGGPNPRSRRLAAYAWLAREMKLPIADTHIGMFNFDQCETATDIVAAALANSSADARG